jgi:hypothetical protein
MDKGSQNITTDEIIGLILPESNRKTLKIRMPHQE